MITHFDYPIQQDIEAANPTVRVPAALNAMIPNGRETTVLHRLGYRRWRNLYPPRQLALLLEACRVAAAVEVSDVVRNRIQLAVAGAGEMAGFLSRWDRFHPKAFEALANHRYSSTSLAVETNLIGARGRGTLVRRLKASIAAARWMKDNFASNSDSSITIVTGSSSTQRLADNSVALIVTDPPYYDAVQYGELSALFRVWGAVAKRDLQWHFDFGQEALPHSSQKIGYQSLLRQIFEEAARTLAPDGRLILTFHSTDFRGWIALGLALNNAGFETVALGVGHSENEDDHAKRNRLAFSCDLVIECKKSGTAPVRAPLIVTNPKSAEERELLAAGAAIALHAKDGVAAMVAAFRTGTARLKTKRITVVDEQRRDR